ncbi:hypothetical protein [Roseibium sp. M-1]
MFHQASHAERPSSTRQAARMLLKGADPDKLPIREISANAATLYIKAANKAPPKLLLKNANNQIDLK